METSQTEMQREKKEQNVQAMWENYKRCNICIMQMPEGRERDKGTEEIFKN